MIALPNPWTSESATTTEDIKARPAVGDPLVAGATDFSVLADEPLPLFLTEAAPEIDLGIAAILRVIFGIHDSPGMA